MVERAPDQRSKEKGPTRKTHRVVAVKEAQDQGRHTLLKHVVLHSVAAKDMVERELPVAAHEQRVARERRDALRASIQAFFARQGPDSHRHTHTLTVRRGFRGSSACRGQVNHGRPHLGHYVGLKRPAHDSQSKGCLLLHGSGLPAVAFTLHPGRRTSLEPK